MTDTEWTELLRLDKEKAMAGIIAQYSALVASIVRNCLSEVCSREDIEASIKELETLKALGFAIRIMKCTEKL